MKRSTVVLGVAVAVLIGMQCFAQSISKTNTIKVTGNGVLDEKGDMVCSLVVAYPTESFYAAMKSAYPNPYTLARDVLGSSGIGDLANPNVEWKDAQRSLQLNVTVRGAAFYRRGRWHIKTATKDTELLFAEGERAIFQDIISVGRGIVSVSVWNLKLPKGTSGGTLEPGSGEFTYRFPREAVKGAATVDVALKTKPRIMSLLYKVYGTKTVGGGAYWVGKGIFKNTGEGDVTDLKMSYRLGEYCDWSSGDAYNLIPPGGTVVDLFYPILSRKITELRTSTPVDLEVKFTYKDAEGKSHEDSTSGRIQILGANQYEFSNLSPQESTGSFLDGTANANLQAAFVMKMDEPVRALGGMVAQCSGGVAASLSDESAVAYCRTLYEILRYNGVSYMTGTSAMNESTLVQDIKYPRDVLRDKSGTCVELAILYAAVCENTNLKSHLVVISGHVYPVIELPKSRQMLPVEVTMLGGSAVNKSGNFDDAVKMGQKELGELQPGKFHWVDVGAVQQEGVTPPELPSLPPTALKDWGWKNPVDQPRTGGQPGERKTDAGPSASVYQGVYVSSAGGRNAMMVTFNQKGNKLDGTIELTNEGKGTLVGEVSGNNIAFNANIQFAAGVATVAFKGIIEGTKISGTYAVQGGRTGQFTLVVKGQ